MGVLPYYIQKYYYFERKESSMESAQTNQHYQAKRIIARTITVLLWVIFVSCCVYAINWTLRLWPATLMLLVFILALGALTVVGGVGYWLGTLLGRRLAKWSVWDRKMSEILCAFIIDCIFAAPLLWFLCSNHWGWVVAVWNFGLTLPQVPM